MQQLKQVIRKRNKLVLLILLGVPFGFFIIKSVVKDGRLIHNGIIINGTITGWKAGYRGYVIFKYEFISKGIIYRGESGYPQLISLAKKDFIGRRIPVLYVVDNPGVNKLLLCESDYVKYKKPFPDSLNWVKDYELK
jgi:hypothetical protein